MKRKRITNIALSSLLLVGGIFNVCMNVKASEHRSPEVRHIAPSITEKTIHGQDFNLQDLRGKVVLIKLGKPPALPGDSQSLTIPEI